MYEPSSPHSPWRPLAAQLQQAPPPPFSMEQAMKISAKLDKKNARRRCIDVAAAAEHTTACIVEFDSPPTTALSNNKPRASFLGWFPPVDKYNRVAEAPYECLQLRLGMDLDIKAAKKAARSDDDDDDDDDGIWNDWYEDEDDYNVDLDHPKRPAPLLWLRFPLHTITPKGMSRDEGDDELVYLLMPAYTFLPEKPTRTDDNKTAGAATTEPASRSTSFGSSNNSGSMSKNYPTPTSDNDAASPPSSSPSSDDVEITGGTITLTRYIDANAATGYQPPRYILAAAAEAGIDVHALCYMDIELAPSTTRPGSGGAPIAVMPARWMRLRSAVENALLGDLRDAGECGALRVHAVWSKKLAGAVEECGRRLRRRAEKAVREGGVDVGGKKQQRRERDRLGRARALVLPDEKFAGVEAWSNFVKWRGVAAKAKKVKCEHMLSSTVAKLGLIEESDEESEDESDGEEVVVEKKRAKGEKGVVEVTVKKRKVSHGDGGSSLAKVSGSKAFAMAKGSNA